MPKKFKPPARTSYTDSDADPVRDFGTAAEKRAVAAGEEDYFARYPGFSDGSSARAEAYDNDITKPLRKALESIYSRRDSEIKRMRSGKDLTE